MLLFFLSSSSLLFCPLPLFSSSFTLVSFSISLSPPLSCSIPSLKPAHLPIGPLADLSSGLYDDALDSDVEEVEPADTRDHKGVGGSVTSPQGNLPRLPFFKKVTPGDNPRMHQ